MKLEVIVATMNQDDLSILKKMNINSDVIIGNQAKRNEIIETTYNSYKVKYLTFNEKGVGLNRNNCIMRATGDICVFADDDIVFVDNYCEIITDEFKRQPKADVIVFNIHENVITRYINKKRRRVSFLNGFRYGAVRIAFKLSSIKEAGIFFNLSFGGGTKYSHGEDVLFIQECLKKGLKVYTSPQFISSLLDDRESTWFKGYNDKFFYDHAALYYTVSKKMWKLLCLQDAFRHHKKYGYSFLKCYKKMISFKKRR